MSTDNVKKRSLRDFQSKTSTRTLIEESGDAVTPENTTMDAALNSGQPVFFAFPESADRGIYIFATREADKFLRLLAVSTTIPIFTPSGCFAFEGEIFSTRIYCPSEERSLSLYLQFKWRIIKDPSLLMDPVPLVEEFGGRVFGRDVRTYDSERLRRIAECSA